jgi:hypothetical protein
MPSLCHDDEEDSPFRDVFTQPTVSSSCIFLHKIDSRFSRHSL